MRKSIFFFLACVAFISGIAIHSLVSPERRILDPFWWYAGFLGCGMIGVSVLGSRNSLGCVSRRLKTGGYICIFFALAFLGFFRYGQSVPVIDEQHIAYYVGREVTVRGVVDSLPRVREKTVVYVIKVSADRRASLRSARDDVQLEGKLLLTTERLPEYKYGDTLTFTCTPAALNEYEQYARKDGVLASCAFPSQIARVIMSEAKEPGFHSTGFFTAFRMTLYVIRARVHAQLASLFPDPYGGLLAGILYGDTSSISSSLKDTFRVSGLAHITALSGYNISIMSRVLMSALIFVWLTRKQALPVTLAMITGFVLATGAEASVVRAAIMGSLVALAKGIGRLAKMQNALALAGAIMLAISPRLLRFDLGFALSFLSTIALLAFSDPLARRSLIRYFPKAFGIQEAAASSAAALLITLPLILYVIGKIGPFSLLVNILVVPVVPFAMGVGAAAVAADFIFHPLAVPVAWATRLLLGYIVSVAEYFGRFGALQVRLNAFFAVVLFVCVTGGLWIWMRRKDVPKKPRLLSPHPLVAKIRRIYSQWRTLFRDGYRAIVPLHWRKASRWIALGFIGGVILAGQFFLRREPPLAVYFYNIGQGDGFLIRTRQGFDVLVDGGPTERIVEKLGRTLPYWDRTIELMILTHPHADHVVGQTAVLKRFQVDKVLSTGVLHTTDEYLEWLKEIRDRKIPLEIAKAGETLAVGPATLTILWPQEDFSGKRVKEGKIGEGGGLNDTSVVMKLIFGQTSFLLMGDATSTVEEQLVAACDPMGANYESAANLRISNSEIRKFGHNSQFAPLKDGCILRADLLKVGHHGSKYSTSAEFLEAVLPKYAVIQSGKENRYGHPAYAPLYRLKQAGVKVFRNDQDGDVVCESNGNMVSCKKQ